MRVFTLSCLLLLFVPVAGQAAIAPAQPPAENSTDKPVILVMGDSLSAAYGIPREAGWVALLQARLHGCGYRIVNASISGETTAGALTRLPHALEQYQPAIVILELGGNDGLRGIAVPEFRHNLTRLITLSQAAGAKILLTGIRLPSNYGPQYTEKFFAVYAALATEYDTALVPFFMDGVALDPELIQGDGIHPNAAGQPRLLENVWPHLQPLLGSVCQAE